MYGVIKLAGLSAALAGALMVAAGQHGEASGAAKFLTERLETQAVSSPAAIPAKAIDARDAGSEAGCSGAWPYRACAGATTGRAAVRVIASGAASPVRR